MRLTLSDSDLHNEDGTHRSTPPAGSGIMPELYSHGLRRHQEEHDAEKLDEEGS